MITMRDEKKHILILVLAVVLAAGWGAYVLAAERIVARVNDVPVTEQQLDEAVDQLVPRASFHGTVTAERLAAFQERALEDLIAVELQYQHGIALGIKPDRKRVKDRMRQVRDAFPSKDEYRSWLKRIGRTEDQVRKMVEREDVVSSAFTRMVVEPAAVGDKELREYYERHPDEFKEPEMVRLRIISAQDEAKAQDVLAKIRDGQNFADLAARFSEDDFRIKGGDIGYVHRGRIYPEIEEIAFVLPIGAVSGAISAEGRWFIVKVEDRKDAHQASFDEARDKLAKKLESKNRTELAKAWIAGLREKAKIEIYLKSQTTGTNR